jgi:hypothetical protein
LPFGDRSGLVRRRIAPASILRTLAMSAVVAGLLVIWVQWNRSITPASQPSGVPEASAAPADPVAQFADTNVGHLLFTSRDHTNCRRVLFDNRTGVMAQAGAVSCSAPPARPVDVSSADRMLGLRKTFGR